MNLWELPEQKVAGVERFDDSLPKEFALRLNEIGIHRGSSIKCLKVVPFNGPRVYQISDGVFSLEKSAAERIYLSGTQS